MYAPGRSRRRDSAPNGAGCGSCTQPRQYPRGFARPGNGRPSRSRHTFQSGRSIRSGGRSGESAYQSGQFHRPGTRVQTSRIHRHGIRRRTPTAPRQTGTPVGTLPKPRHGFAHRSEPRLAATATPPPAWSNLPWSFCVYAATNASPTW